MDIFGIKRLKDELSELSYKMYQLTEYDKNGSLKLKPLSYLAGLERIISKFYELDNRLQKIEGRIWKLENPPKYEGKVVNYDKYGDGISVEVKAVNPKYFHSDRTNTGYWTYTLLKDCDVYAEGVYERNLSPIEKKD